MDRLDHLFDDYPAGKPELEIVGKNFVGLWDSFRMEQLFTNLLTNAHRYGNNKPIKIRLEDHLDTISFSVMDNGVGIQEVDREIIFEQFSQVAAGKTIKEGMGLGLFISKEIVKAHLGKIMINSEMGVGSTFAVKLPEK